MKEIEEDLKKRYKEHHLKSEIYLWQLYILEHPKDVEAYRNAIADNFKKLKELNISMQEYILRTERRLTKLETIISKESDILDYLKGKDSDD